VYPVLILFAAASILTAAPFPQQVALRYQTADGLPSPDVHGLALRNGTVAARTPDGIFEFNGTRWLRSQAALPAKPAAVRLEVTDGKRRWIVPRAIMLRDAKGREWFAGPGQGAGMRERADAPWRLFTGAEGLPWDEFTSLAAAPDGSVWFGTSKGAIHFDGTTWEYRQGARWLPSDDVRDVVVQQNGDAWFATAAGIGRITTKPTTLAEKAAFFEKEIDARHRRTPYGYVESVALPRPGDLSSWQQHDSDNDGLWTAMYGAGECFAWKVTRNPDARRRAVAAFEALRFLGTVTQGGRNAPPKGFVARSILPVGGPDPNLRDSPERDKQMAATRDRLWKQGLVPRWPVSAVGKWYWKTDTSSDELDGHYFFYSLYFDLVAETEAEKKAVRDHVAALTDHLIHFGFRLVDHDGRTTRWGAFGPESLNHDPMWQEERGLNSLSILAYLRTTAHITGDAKYHAAANELAAKHGYAANVLIPKTNAGPGSGNQSDDEMAFMNFYCLLKYETDARMRTLFGKAFHDRWTMEAPELNPVFNYLYAASSKGLRWRNAFEDRALEPDGAWREESLDALKRFPLDRLNWGVRNSHRLDLMRLPAWASDGNRNRGHRRDGRVLPIDERYVDKWNHDPWALDYNGDGRRLADGASFLLPYYMGLYFGFLEQE